MILFQQNCYFCITVSPIHRINRGLWQEAIESFFPPNFRDSESGNSDIVTFQLGLQTDFNHRNQSLSESYLAVSMKTFKVEFMIAI